MSRSDLRPADECRWDLVSLGEVMLRLDPGEGRIETTRTFQAWEGGGEYNVARGLKRCFGLRTAIVTALADNPVGRLIDDLIYQGGVERAHLGWVPYDGVGREVRNGLNFTERGFGVRGAVGVSDRGHTAASQLKPGDVDWEQIFGRTARAGSTAAASSRRSRRRRPTSRSRRWRRRGATAPSSPTTSTTARRCGSRSAGPARAAEVNRQLVEHVDVLLGNEEDFSAALGFEIEGVDENLLHLDLDAYARLLEQVLAAYPQLAVVATTLREVRSATVNDWSAVCRTRDGFHVGPSYEALEILDRVGGGDSFASGLFYGLLNGWDVEKALAYGVAHGALAMTTPGDTSMATLAEVERLVAGGSARVQR